MKEGFSEMFDIFRSRLTGLSLVAVLGLIWLSAFVIPPQAAAQLSSDGGPIRIRSNSSEVQEKERKVIFKTDVEVVQADARLTADTLTINYTGNADETASGLGGGFGDIRNLIAEGDVFYITPEIQVRGDEGIYTEVDQTIELTGEVLLRRGEDVARGCKMTISIALELSELSGCDDTGVVMVINPEESP